MSTILVVGATGLLGSEICRQLTETGKKVRALIRDTSDPAKVSRLASLGAETVVGDVRDRASLDRACRDVEAVICTVSSVPFSYQPGVNDFQTVDIDGVSNLIEAARTNGVSQFIYTSFTKNINSDMPLNNAKRAVERRLQDSGLVYTILRPSCFMEVWLSPVVGFDPANAKAVIYGWGQNPLSWIAIEDVARFAVASLDQSAARNAVLELGGPEAVSPLDVVKVFEEASGRSFELQFVPEEALDAQIAAAPDPFQKSFSALTRFVAQGDPIEMTATIQTFGIQPRSVQEYARRVVTPA